MTQPPTGRIAPISRRAIAYLIDALIAGGLAAVLGVVLVVIATASASAASSGSVAEARDAALGGLGILLIGMPLVGLLLLGWFVLYTVMQSGRGSIGMRAQGLRLVAEDGSSLGFGRTLLRNIVFGLSAGIVVGYFTPLFDGSGRFQGWHDKVAKSLMVDARGEAAPARPTSPRAAHSPTATPVPGLVAAETATPGVPGIPVPPAMPAGYAPPGAPQAPAVPAAPPLPVPAAPVAPAAPFARSEVPAAPSYTPPAVPPAPVPPAPAVPPSADPSSADAGAVAVAPPLATPAASADDVIAYVPGITLDAPPRAAAPSPVVPPAAAPESQAAPVPPAPAAPPAPAFPAAASPAAAPSARSSVEDSPDVVDEDVVDEDVEETRISIPGHRLVFTWDDGTRVTVSRRTVFGRNPAAEEGAVVVPVRDETLSLSKTHFEAAASTSGGWVLDRFSTNGMTLVRDGQRIACPAGQRVPVRLGDALEIGDRIVTIGGYA